MEEYKYKFSQNCSILTLNGVSSLVTKIRSLHKTMNQSDFNKHYKYLKEHAISPKNSVASSAMLGLIDLTQEPDEVVPLNVVIKDLMSAVPNVQNMSGIIDLIFYALFKHSKMTCYDIIKNQHPLITVLKKDQTCWPHILYRIEEKFRTENKAKVLQKLQPFALFVLYDYDQKLEQVLQLELLNIYKSYLDNMSKQKMIILNLTHIPRSLRYCKVLIPEVPELLTYVITAILKLLLHDQDASEAIWILHQNISSRLGFDNSLEILLTADCIPIAPVSAMETLCECVDIMLSTQKYPTIVTSIVKTSLLCWKMHFHFTTSSVLVQKLSDKIDDVLSRQFEHNDADLPNFEYLDEKQYVYTYLLSNDLTVNFFDKLETAPLNILEMLFSFLLGYFYDDNDTDVTLMVLQLCLKTCQVQPRYTSRMLPVLLHKISCSVQPDLHLALLTKLPQLGVLKENISPIVMTIKAISNVSTQMHAFAIKLMYDLVLVDKICFPYLEELLTKDQDVKEYELVVSKAYVVKELCKNMSTYNLENYRKELAGFVSKALTKTTENKLVMTLSFEALKYLCHGFDPYTTMLSLTQRFDKMDDDCILIGICGIMGEVANMSDVPETRMGEVVKKLFGYAESHPSKDVLTAVYSALGNFNMEEIAVGFPAVYTHLTNDNSILGSLAGACWVNLLQFGPSDGLKPVADLLIRFIDNDMKTYKRSNYEISEGHGEPVYMPLTRDNVLAAVAKFVKKNSSKLGSVQREVYLEGLRILNTKYIRPLPPMDWSFLSTLKEHKDMREYLINIAARQSSVSGSARRFIENYIKDVTDRNQLNEDVVYIYMNIHILCNTIQPVIFKPFIKKTIKLGLLNMEHSHDEIEFMLEKIEAMLKSPSTLESNKAAVAEVLVANFDGIELESDASEKILPVLGYVPRQYLNEYSPVQFETVNDAIMLRCLSVHCAMALANEQKPFGMLDGVIDCRILKSCVQPAFNFETMFWKLAPVFEKYRDHTTLPSWFNEVTNRISVELAEKKDIRNAIFASTVFIIAVVVSSGYHIFTNDDANLENFSIVFPYALGSLLSKPSYSGHAAQILESMYDFATNSSYRRNNVLGDHITRRFKHGLLVMRSHESFNEKFAWMKFVEVNF